MDISGEVDQSYNEVTAGINSEILLFQDSVVHSHWSRNVEAWLSLVESVAGASHLMP